MLAHLIVLWHHLAATTSFQGAVAGVFAAAAVDYRAFSTWKSAHDAAVYDWKTAGWRWFQGAITGIVGAWALWGVS